MNECPSQSVLESWGAGELPGEDVGRVARHVATCVPCRTKLTDLGVLGCRVLAPATSRIEELERIHPEYDSQQFEYLLRNIDCEAGERVELPSTLTTGTQLVKGTTLGQGGMGEVVVYRDRALDRDVAVKLISNLVWRSVDPDSRAALCRRFEQEYAITSLLEHPGIAPVYGIGRCGDDGLIASSCDDRPFYVMRKIEGRTLAECIAEFHSAGGRLSRGDSAFLRLLSSFKTVCETIRYAHDRGIWHRDLKPQNIMVNRDVTIVLDWGLARVARQAAKSGDGGAPPAATATRSSAVRLVDAVTPSNDSNAGGPLGSIPYMSPEQAAGQVDAIDNRTDIYGLGAILFEILTGSPPHEKTSSSPGPRLHRDDASGVSKELLAQIQLAPTPRPSERRRRHITSKQGGESIGEPLVDESVPPELESICLKAMAKCPADRYATAQDVADELEAWLVGNVVRSHTYSTAELLQRWSRRNAGWLSMLVLASLLFAIISVVAAAAVKQSRDAERRQRQAAQQQRDEARERARESDTLRQKFQNDYLVEALASGREDENSFLQVGSATPSNGGWDWWYLNHVASTKPVLWKSYSTATRSMLAAVVNSDQTRLAASDAAGQLTVREYPSGRVIRQWGELRVGSESKLPMHHFHQRAPGTKLEEWGDCYSALAWHAQPDQLVAASTGGTAWQCDVRTGERRSWWTHEKALTTLGATPDGERFLFGAVDGHLRLCHADGTQAAARPGDGSEISVIRWMASPEAWLVGNGKGELRILAVEDLRELAALRDATSGPVWAVDVGDTSESPRIAVADGSADIKLLRWDAEGHRLTSEPPVHFPGGTTPARVHAVCLGEQGRQLYAVSQSGDLVVWTLDPLRPMWRNRIANVDKIRVKLADQLGVATPPVVFPLAFRKIVTALTLLADDRLLAAADDSRVTVWAIPSTSTPGVTTYAQAIGIESEIAFATDSPYELWAMGRDGRLIAIDANTGAVLARHEEAHNGKDAGLVALPSGEFATVGGDAQVRFWRRHDSRIVESSRRPFEHDGPLKSLTFCESRGWLAAVDCEANLVIWELKSGRVLFRDLLGGGDDRSVLTGKLAFSRNGDYLAAFGRGQAAPIYRCQSRPAGFRRLPDQLWAAGNGGTAVVWNPAWKDVAVIGDSQQRLHSRSVEGYEGQSEHHYDSISSDIVAFCITPDERRLVAIEKNGKLKFFDTRFRILMLELASTLQDPCGLAIDRTGRWIAVAGKDGSVEVWDNHPPGSAHDVLPLETETRWISQDLATPSDLKYQWHPDTIVFDSQNRLQMLWTEANPTAFRNDGQLVHVVADRNGVRREPLTAPRPEFDSRADFAAAALRLDQDDNPEVTWRRKIAEVDPYDGELLISRRDVSGAWSYETVFEHGNRGFYPVVIPGADGRASSILYHYYDKMSLFIAKRYGDGTWHHETIGQQGDGFRLVGRRDSQGNWHLLCGVQRFNSDRVGHAYLRYDPKTDTLLREPLSHHGVLQDEIRLLNDGTPVVLARRFDPIRKQYDNLLMKRTDAGWVDFKRLPGADANRLTWDIGPQDAVGVLIANDATAELSYVSEKGGQWVRSVVDRLQPSFVRNQVVVRFDRSGQPIILVGRVAVPPGYLKLWRPARR